MNTFRSLLAVAGWVLVLAAAAAMAAPAPVLQDPSVPGAELKDLRDRLRELERDVARTEESHKEAVDALRESEMAISAANRRLYQLNRDQDAKRQRLQQLESQSTELQRRIRRELDLLERSLRSHYVNGRVQALPSLLAGRDAAGAAREIDYLDYVSRARKGNVESLRRDIAALDQNTAQVKAETAELEKIQSEQSEQKQKLEKEQQNRRKVASGLAQKLTQQRRVVDGMKRDEARLTHLVEELTRLIAKREADRKAREKRAAARREAARLALERQEAARRLAEAKHPAGSARALPPPAPVPPAHVTPPADTADSEGEGEDEDIPAGAFARLRGRLHLPVLGELANRYGSQRQDSGLSWKGLFIRARAGADVKAVAAGRVVYANWLRGFGNLLILDHGGGYMSLYGNNETLYGQVGDSIKGGQSVAVVGNSGGNPESGLYFELRFQSKPFDPLGWIAH